VQPGDLRAALEKLLADDAGRKKLGEAARNSRRETVHGSRPRNWRRFSLSAW